MHTMMIVLINQLLYFYCATQKDFREFYYGNYIIAFILAIWQNNFA